MKYIKINNLNGIPDEYVELLTDLVGRIKHKEILLIVLYFMSDLDDGNCTLKDIERNMRKIFNKNYKDYAASNIRGYVNSETLQVKEGKLKKEQRLWVHTTDGVWQNSELGNSKAKQILYNEGIEIIESTANSADLEEIKEIERDTENLVGEERRANLKVRVNQSKFRRILLDRSSQCKICGLKRPELLTASHTKSWVDSTGKEKLDFYNGFLLCPAHDALFDKHLISFDDTGRILVSSQLTEEEMKLLNIDHGITIEIEEGHKKYLKHHRAIMASKQ